MGVLGYCALFRQSFIASSILLSATGAERQGAERFARGNCGYGFEALKAMVLGVEQCLYRGFYRLAPRAIDAYSAGMQNGVDINRITR